MADIMITARDRMSDVLRKIMTFYWKAKFFIFNKESIAIYNPKEYSEIIKCVFGMKGFDKCAYISIGSYNSRSVSGLSLDKVGRIERVAWKT